MLNGGMRCEMDMSLFVMGSGGRSLLLSASAFWIGIVLANSNGGDAVVECRE